MNKINVCLSCDDNYAIYAGVVIASILSNASDNDSLTFYILDGGISNNKKDQILQLKSIKDCEICFVQINQDDFEDYKPVCTHKYISIATYYRLKLASLLPQVDKIIYFDCDMIVNSGLSDLFNVDLKDYLIAGVKDINKRMLKSNPAYINAGMILFNLKNIREQGIENKFLEWTIHNIDNIKVGDQTIINEVCKGKIKIVDDSWNVQSSNFTNRSSYTNTPKVVHFVAKNKPWNGKSFSYHKNLYFKYLQLTPWKLSDEELQKSLKSTAINYIKYRPLFLLRPRFYKALFLTYFLKLFTLTEDKYEKKYYLFNKYKVLSIQKNTKDRDFINCLGVKLTIRKNNLSNRQIRNINNKYEHYYNNEKYPKVKTRVDTLKELINSNKSISRFGDGEFNLMMGEDLPFQRYSKKLADKIQEILLSCDDNIMIAIPDTFASLEHYTKHEASFWRKYIAYHRDEIYKFLNFDKQYYDTEVSRPYMGVKDKSLCRYYFQNFKKVWKNKDVVFVEGEATRLGYNNDLFDNVKSVKRILCPAKNAFDKYEDILEECKKQPHNVLFIIALGPTATLLAYDLTKIGYRALDLGHIDIEYEWFLRQAKKKIAIPKKYVNEAKKGKNIIPLENQKYCKEIICNLTTNTQHKEQLNFLIFNTACLGDVLLCNSLCQNIKHIFPNSKIIFIVDKNWYDAAKYQEGVDDVVIYDKKGIHKGFKGFIKFIKDFKYKNIYASVITYKNERNYLLSVFLKCKYILMTYKKLNLSVQNKNNYLLNSITDEKINNYPIKFNLPDNIINPLNTFNLPADKYITLCCISKKQIKDMPLSTAIELIDRINNESLLKVVLVGTGKNSLAFSKQLENASCKFINLVNKTSILELGKVIKDSKCLISVDTGTMHLGNALSIPTVAVFYDRNALTGWAPDKKLYNAEIIHSNQTAINIFNATKNIIRNSYE